MPIRIPIIGQSTSATFTPQQSRDAIQISDPRGQALQGLGKSIGDLGDAVDRRNQAQALKQQQFEQTLAANQAQDDQDAAMPQPSPIAIKQTQDNNAWALQAYAQCVAHGADLTDHLQGLAVPGDDSGSPPPANPADLLNTPNPVQAFAGMIGSLGGAGRSAGSPASNPAGNPAAAGGLSGLLPGASGSSADTPPNPTDPNLHGTTGAWINGYDLGAKAAIAAAPSKPIADSLITQLSADRAQGARNIIGFEARNNVQQRQDTAVSSIQTIAARGVAADPATLPQALAFLERHPVRVDGGPQAQASFDAGLRHTLVDAGMQSLIARDPQGVVNALRGAAPGTNNTGTPGASGKDGISEENGTASPDAASPDPANPDRASPPAPAVPLHPALTVLTPAERAAYLPQAIAANAAAQSNFQAGVRERTATAIAAYNTTGNAANPPAQADFVKAFGPEEGAVQFQKLQQAQQAGQLRQQLLPLPGRHLDDLVERSKAITADGPYIANPSEDKAAVAIPAVAYYGQGASPDMLAGVVAQLRRQRASDPIQAASDAKSYGIKPIDFSASAISGGTLGSALRARAQVADDIGRDYQVAPAALSQAEIQQLAGAFQGQTPQQQQALLKQVSDNLNNPALTQTVLRNLSVHELVIALAGFHQAVEDAGAAPADVDPSAPAPATEGQDDTGLLDLPAAQRTWGGGGKLNAAELLLQGNALLQPQADASSKGSKPVPMPPLQEMWHSFSALTGDAYASQPGAEAMQFAGAKAIYAALKSRDDNNSTVLDPIRMHAAAFISKYGSATAPEAGLAGTAYTDALVSTPTVDGDMPARGGSPYLIKTSMPMSTDGASWVARKMLPASPSSAPVDSNTTAGALPGIPPLAPIDDHAAGTKQQTFVEGLKDLFTVAQAGNPASYTQGQAQNQLDISLAARQKLRDVGKWMEQDPSRAAAMLQHSAQLLLSLDGSTTTAPADPTPKGLDDAVAHQGGNAQQILNTVKGLVNLIQTGDPKSPEVARQIGAGLQFVLSPENSQIAPGLLLGLLSLDGRPSEGIEKALAAAQQIEPGHAAYVWQSLTQAQMAAALSGLEGAGGATVFKAGGAVGKVFAKVQQAVEGLGNRVRGAVPNASLGELAPAGGPGRIPATPPRETPAMAADARQSKPGSEKNANAAPAGTATGHDEVGNDSRAEEEALVGKSTSSSGKTIFKEGSPRDVTWLGVVRNNRKAWRDLQKHWESIGYGDILSAENKAKIAIGLRPNVDESWVKYFPEDAGLKGEKISPHHIGGFPLTVPLAKTRHRDAHMPGGFKYNRGGPGGSIPFYLTKEGEE